MERKSGSIASGAAMLVAAAFLFLSCASIAPSASRTGLALGEWGGGRLVQTRHGVLEGRADRDGTLAWLGIPYAAPPLGDLRWQAPRPPSPWLGTRQATRFASRSIQRSSLLGTTVGSEDSLYLNVWRPATDARDLPVYVWIHGGGNTSGASDASPEYYGHALASRAGLVFVSVNYRLGIFGWFSHPSLRTGDPNTDSGNFGTLDLIASLEWVRDNIAAFGGDPLNVTIAGESAGAFNALTLLIAPAARGLFHKAVVQSGYTRTSKTDPGEYSGQLAGRLALRQGKAENEEEAKAYLESLGGDETAKWLRDASPEELLHLAKPSSRGILPLPYPIFDGTVLPSDGFKALADPERRADLPVLIGTNKEETKLFMFFWRRNSRDPDFRKLAEVTSAVWKAEGADSVADALGTKAGTGKVYLYRFDWGAPDGKGKSVLGSWAGASLGASHGMEIPFFLQTDVVYGNRMPFRIFTAANMKGRLDLQSRIGGYLSNFVRMGNPNPPADGARGDTPHWDPWDASLAEPSFIVLDAGFDKARIVVEYGRAVRDEILLDMESEASEALLKKYLEIAPLLE